MEVRQVRGVKVLDPSWGFDPLPDYDPLETDSLARDRLIESSPARN